MNKFGKTDNGTWFKCLHDLTPKALEMGVERLMGLAQTNKFTEYPPNCLQFRAICLGFYEELKLPPASAAWQELKTQQLIGGGNWSHPVVAYVAAKLTYQVLNMNDERKSYQIFKTFYDKVCMRAKEGHPIPDVKPLFIEKKPNLSVAQKHLADIRRILGERGYEKRINTQ